VNKKVAIIGIGNFGSQLAVDLVQKGAEVLAIDQDMDKLTDLKDEVTHTVCLDSREEKALRSQGLKELDAVVVAMGDDFEAVLLTIAGLQNIGIKRIIARATTAVHERILRHLGIQEIVMPSQETANRLANSILVKGVLDSFPLSGSHGVYEVKTQEKMIGQTVAQLNLWERMGIKLIAIKRMEEKAAVLGLRVKTVESVIGDPSSDLVIQKGDILVVFAAADAIMQLAEET
jgi:trk/ktr system potassium uptake protein